MGVGGSGWAMDRGSPRSTSRLEPGRVSWKLGLKEEEVHSQQLWGLPPPSRVGCGDEASAAWEGTLGTHGGRRIWPGRRPEPSPGLEEA